MTYPSWSRIRHCTTSKRTRSSRFWKSKKTFRFGSVHIVIYSRIGGMYPEISELMDMSSRCRNWYWVRQLPGWWYPPVSSTMAWTFTIYSFPLKASICRGFSTCDDTGEENIGKPWTLPSEQWRPQGADALAPLECINLPNGKEPEMCKKPVDTQLHVGATCVAGSHSSQCSRSIPSFTIITGSTLVRYFRTIL